ncbi:MAG: ABC transporter ATP-binding protein [Thermoguttaceae bacterium]|nr:ABC transporter ATP-binding protein [Thermoguttaceae bacterium]MDW8037179.1 ABC transporter ATP-binding protein [Thermoguttaceae bacterium]
MAADAQNPLNLIPPASPTDRAVRPGQQVSVERPLIDIQDLWVSLEGHPVLRRIRLQVPRGQTLAIIGESGCGKTVLLKTLIALIRPSRGKVYFDGLDLHRLSEKELTRQRRRFGFVFQQAALFDSMNVYQNVAFPLRQHTEKSEEEIRQIVLARLAEVGLSPKILNKMPSELSGGMRKRVGLARALVLEPEVILYDEPTTGLDPIMSDVINELILQTRKRHPVTSIIVTHDMRTAQKTADRVVMLYPLSRLQPHEPQILYDGPPDQIEQSPDERVREFVRGEAEQRLQEIRSGLSEE